MTDKGINVSQKSHILTLRGLSPLHIGSGEKYSQLDYIYHENYIFILDFDKLISEIPLEIIDDLTNDINENFENNIWKGDTKEFLSRYKIDWEKSVEKKYDLIGRIGKNEINQFIKTGNQIYIPGSSIKGAVRTAILFKILKEHPEKKQDVIRNVIDHFNDKEIMKLIQKDGTTDLLRALIISDSHIDKTSPIKITGSTVYHLRNKESTIPIYYEILDENFYSSGTIKINYKLTDSKALISDNFDLTQDNIINAINAFSKEIIDYELKEIIDRIDPNLDDIIGFYKKLNNELTHLKDSECILRLGQGSSILGITLFLNFKDNKQIVRKYKGLEIFHFNIPDRYNKEYGIAKQGRYTILPDRDSPNKPKLNEKWLCSVVTIRGTNKYVTLLEKIKESFDIEEEKARGYLFPLTRKFVVSDNEKLIAPFGWVKLTWD